MLRKFILLPEPTITEKGIKYVTRAVKSCWISSLEEFIVKFEEEFAKFVGTKYALSVSNGTAVLHPSLVALCIRRRDDVIVPDITFIATANAVKYTGATLPGVKIYSLSNYSFDENDSTLITYANANYLVKECTVAYISSPIVIEEGVWIGLNSIVLGGCIGKNAFIASNSIVLKDIPENSYAAGNPAQRIKPRFKMGLKDEK